MKHNLSIRLSLLTLTLLLGSIVAFAQDVSGTYQGMVKRPGAAEEKVTLELKNEGGKITGRATHGDKVAVVTEGKLENGTITLHFGTEGTFTAKVDGDKLVGETVHGTQKMPLELKKVPATAAAPATSAAAPAAGPVDLNGQWEAVADANGQSVPFTLNLKVDGQVVTGGGSSQLGESTIKEGTWKDGKLVMQLEGQNGTISLSAIVVEGKLTGEFDFAGQLQGKWVAVKKN